MMNYRTTAKSLSDSVLSDEVTDEENERQRIRNENKSLIGLDPETTARHRAEEDAEFVEMFRVQFEDMERGFCRKCGASIPHREGEGRCDACMRYLPEDDDYWLRGDKWSDEEMLRMWAENDKKLLWNDGGDPFRHPIPMTIFDEASDFTVDQFNKIFSQKNQVLKALQENDVSINQDVVVDLTAAEAVADLRALADAIEKDEVEAEFVETAEEYNNLLKKADASENCGVGAATPAFNEEKGDYDFANQDDVQEVRGTMTRYDLDCELVREYMYDDGKVIINNPAALYISNSGSHRVVDSDGWATYLPNGWRCIRWLPSNPDVPVSF